MPEPHHLLGPMILLFHYSGHTFDALLAGHLGSAVLRWLLTDAPEFGGVSARLLLLLLLLMLYLLVAVLQLQLLLLLHLLQLLLLQVDAGPVVVRPGDHGFRGGRHRFFGRGPEMLPAKHGGQWHGPSHQVFGRTHGRVVVEPFQVHQVTEAAGRTLGTQHNTRTVVFHTRSRQRPRCHYSTPRHSAAIYIVATMAFAQFFKTFFEGGDLYDCV